MRIIDISFMDGVFGIKMLAFRKKPNAYLNFAGEIVTNYLYKQGATFDTTNIAVTLNKNLGEINEENGSKHKNKSNHFSDENILAGVLNQQNYDDSNYDDDNFNEFRS